MFRKSGDYSVEKRDPKTGKWFPIWTSTNGPDCAQYLKKCVVGDDRTDAEYRLVYIK